jgi:hypothetical protein
MIGTQLGRNLLWLPELHSASHASASSGSQAPIDTYV